MCVCIYIYISIYSYIQSLSLSIYIYIYILQASTRTTASSPPPSTRSTARFRCRSWRPSLRGKQTDNNDETYNLVKGVFYWLKCVKRVMFVKTNSLANSPQDGVSSFHGREGHERGKAMLRSFLGDNVLVSSQELHHVVYRVSCIVYRVSCIVCSV